MKIDSAVAASNAPSGARVLMVEDDEDFRDIVLRRLNRKGLMARGVSHAAAAREACRRESFDVVLLDGSLPDSAGTSVLLDLRRDCPRLPVVFLSGDSDAASVQSALALGAREYLIKPCSLVEVESAIARALGQG